MLAVAVFVALLPALGPEDPVAYGTDIAARADAVDGGWGVEQSRVSITIDTRQSDGADRVFDLTQVEAQGDEGERSLVELVEPARHRGLKLLTLPGPDGEDEVWMRLPAHAETRRIAGRKRSSRFLGSEVSLEDLGSRGYRRFTHRWLRDEPVGGQLCHVVEAVPKDPESSYGRLLLWRQADAGLRLVKVEYYDRASGQRVKEAVSTDFAPVVGQGGKRWWRPSVVVVTNTVTGRATRMTFASRKAQVALAADAVSRRALER